MTEFTGIDSLAYAGPIIVADCHDLAVALLCCLQGPNGQSLRLVGELLFQVPHGEDTESHIRRAS